MTLKKRKDKQLIVYAVVTYREVGHFFIAGCFKNRRKAEKYCGDKLNTTSFIHPLKAI